MTPFLPLTLHSWKRYLNGPTLIVLPITALSTMALPRRFRPSVSAHETHQSSLSKAKSISYKWRYQKGYKKLSLFALIINPANKNGCNTQGYSFYNAHWTYVITLSAVRIKATKAITSLRINIKPTRPTTSILRAHPVYRVSWKLQERYSSPGRLVATVIELFELPLQG